MIFKNIQSSERPNFQSLQRNIFRYNDPTANGDVGVATPATPSSSAAAATASSASASLEPAAKAATLPRNAHLAPVASSAAAASVAGGVATPSASGHAGLSAPGRRTAIDLTTNDDYVMFSALNQVRSIGIDRFFFLVQFDDFFVKY